MGPETTIAVKNLTDYASSIETVLSKCEAAIGLLESIYYNRTHNVKLPTNFDVELYRILEINDGE